MRIHNLSFFMNSNNNYNFLGRSNGVRDKLELLANIIIILSFIWFFLFIKLSIQENNNSFDNTPNEEFSEKETKLNSKYALNNNPNNNTNSTLRELTTFFRGKYDKQDFIRRKQIKSIVDKLTNSKYIGRWFTKEEETRKLRIGKSLEGFTEIKFNRAIEIATRQDAIAVLINNYEDKYINHWLHHSSFILSKNLYFKIDKKTNQCIFNGKFETEANYGELFFTKMSTRYPCNSNLTIIFPLTNITLLTNTTNGESFIETIETIDNSNLSISFNSSCGFNMSMELYIDDQKRRKQTQVEVNKYTIIISIILLLYMISVHLMNRDLKKNNEAIKCIYLFTIIQNLNWHVYCCMTHISWSISNNRYFSHFSIIAFLYSINIIGFDFKFIFNYWTIKKDSISYRSFINLKIIFYSSFYVFFFISFFFISDLMIYYFPIYVCCLFLWTPQIIYNAVYYNKFNYPFFYIICSTVERLFFGFYFRANDENFFKIKGSKNFVYFISIYLFLNYLILILQTLKGPRFFMPKKYQKEDFDFYKTKEELLESSPDIANVECVICLLPIFVDETPIENKNEIEKEKEKEDNNSVSANTSRSGIQMTTNEFMKENNNNLEMNVIKQKKNNKDNKNEVNNHKKSSKNCSDFYYFIDILLIKGFCCFYKLSKNSENKIYMKTPCNHVFHAACFEKWLIRKKECPNCRYNLSDKIS